VVIRLSGFATLDDDLCSSHIREIIRPKRKKHLGDKHQQTKGSTRKHRRLERSRFPADAFAYPDPAPGADE